jgi:hypothetical protein
MPRSKRKAGQSSWTSDRFVLNLNQRRKLLERLGTDEVEDHDAREEKETRAILLIEHILGAHGGAVEALNRAPRAADFRDTLQPLRQQADKLREQLQRLGDRFRKPLEARGINSRELEDKLGMLWAACGAVIERISADQPESRGRPVDAAHSYIVADLQKVFDKCYSGPDGAPVSHGAVTPLSEREANKQEFVELALHFAGIGSATKRG